MNNQIGNACKPQSNHVADLWRHIFILLTFFCMSSGLYVLLSVIALSSNVPVLLFLLEWTLCFLLYFAVCIWVMKTRPLAGRRKWVELGIIFAGALIFRVMLLPLPPGLSHDAWRYLWDARVIMHGYSPYLYAPMDKVLVPLRDNVVYASAVYRQFPTKYPPGAELSFVLGYLLSPSNLTGFKVLLVVCDTVTCGALTLILLRKGLDPRRVIIYAWCPLPIVEFAIEGHGEAFLVTLMVLAVLFAGSSWRGSRLLTGICIGLAMLIKLYPIILLLALMRRRDWQMLAACVGTIVLGYVPFILLDQWHISDVVFSFAGQNEAHVGVIQDVFTLAGYALGISQTSIRFVADGIGVVLMAATTIIVLARRWSERMSAEGTILLLSWMVLVVYAHVFPWYATALLPWIAVLAEPEWMKHGNNARSQAIALMWFFTFIVIESYMLDSQQYPQYVAVAILLIYYLLAFGIVAIGLGKVARVSMAGTHFP